MDHVHHSVAKKQSHDSHMMIPTLVGLYNVFTCTGSSNETAFSSGDLMSGVAPGRSARGSISREAWTKVKERTGCVERHGRRKQDEFTSDTPLLQCAPAISGAISDYFHYATPLFNFATPPVPLCTSSKWCNQ